MDFKLRTILILLAVVITGVIISIYSVIMNVVQPLVEQMPTGVNMYAGGNIVSRETWLVNREHLAQSIISRQAHHDVFLSWDNTALLLPADIPHLHLTRRMIFPTAAQIAAAPMNVQNEILMRGGFVLLHPMRDADTAPVPNWDRINNENINNRVNILNVAGMPGSHYHVVQDFLTMRHPNVRTFRITQYLHDNGDAFFVFCVAGSGDILCY